MTDEYRDAFGRVFGGPFERTAGDHTVYTYSFSAVGLNGNTVLKLEFWDEDPDYIEIGSAYYISGKYQVWTSADGEKSSKSISPNFVVPIGENVVKKRKQAAPKKKPTPKGETPTYDF